MKYLRITFFALLISIFPFTYVYGEVDIITGVKLWYTSWNPYIKNMGKKVSPQEGWQYIDTGSGMMYGPSIGIMFNNKWNISMSYLYGHLLATYEADFATYGNDNNLREYHYNGSAKTIRHDLDTVIGYKFNDYIKFFIGFKYQPVIMRTKKKGGVFELNDATGLREQIGAYNDGSEITFRQKNYAPGAGIGLSVTIFDNVVFTLNTSFIYLFGNTTTKLNPTIVYYNNDNDWSDMTFSLPSFTKMNFKVAGIGTNIDPIFVLIIRDTLLVNIGFRLQYVSLKSKDPIYRRKINDLNDYLYGINFSVMYNFEVIK